MDAKILIILNKLKGGERLTGKGKTIKGKVYGKMKNQHKILTARKSFG